MENKGLFTIEEVNVILLALFNYYERGGMGQEMFDELRDKFNGWVIWTSMMGDE